MAPSKRTTLAALGAGMMALVVVGVVAKPAAPPPQAREASTPTGTPPVAPSPTPPTPEPAWSYRIPKDEMSGDHMRIARCESTNLLVLEGMYSKPQTADLVIRNHPRHGLSAFLTIDHGQFDFHGGTVELLVRIDDRPAFRVMADGSVAGRNDSAFFPNAKGLVAKIANAKEVRIEAPFWRSGLKVLVFRVEGLKQDWIERKG